MHSSGIETVDLLVTPDTDDSRIETLARAQIAEDWGEITYKLQSIMHVHSGPISLQSEDGESLGEIDAKMFIVAFKLLH